MEGIVGCKCHYAILENLDVVNVVDDSPSRQDAAEDRMNRAFLERNDEEVARGTERIALQLACLFVARTGDFPERERRKVALE